MWRTSGWLECKTVPWLWKAFEDLSKGWIWDYCVTQLFHSLHMYQGNKGVVCVATQTCTYTVIHGGIIPSSQNGKKYKWPSTDEWILKCGLSMQWVLFSHGKEWRDFLVVQRLGLYLPNAGCAGSILVGNWDPTFLEVKGQDRTRQYCNRFNKNFENGPHQRKSLKETEMKYWHTLQHG